MISYQAYSSKLLILSKNHYGAQILGGEGISPKALWVPPPMKCMFPDAKLLRVKVHLHHIACRYVFDNLSCDQAEDLLWQHGEDGMYLVSHFHDPESYGMSIRVR